MTVDTGFTSPTVSRIELSEGIQKSRVLIVFDSVTLTSAFKYLFNSYTSFKKQLKLL